MYPYKCIRQPRWLDTGVRYRPAKSHASCVTLAPFPLINTFPPAFAISSRILFFWKWTIFSKSYVFICTILKVNAKHQHKITWSRSVIGVRQPHTYQGTFIIVLWLYICLMFQLTFIKDRFFERNSTCQCERNGKVVYTLQFETVVKSNWLY